MTSGEKKERRKFAGWPMRLARRRFSLTTLLLLVASFAGLFAASTYVIPWASRKLTPRNSFRVNDANGRRSVKYIKPYPPKYSLRDLTFIEDVDDFTMTRYLKGEDLRYISGWQGLTYLDISGNQISDEDLWHLQELTSLKQLRLRGMGIRGPGLRYLRQMHQLQTLSLSDNPVSAPADVKHIAALENLKSLSLSGTQVTSECIGSLTTLRNLERLNLSNTPVDDAVVEHLLKFPSLKECKVSRTSMTSSGYRRLSQSGIEYLDSH